MSSASHPSWSPLQAWAGVVAALGVVSAKRFAAARSRATNSIARLCDMEIGEDLSVPDDSFIVCGLAHCFEQIEGGKLADVYVLEPVSASTVEVVNNGCQTSYEAFVGTSVGELLGQDTSAFPAELLCGHTDVRFADNLEFRTGCAARTWMRDHAQDVVRKLVPPGEVKSGFNSSTENKRILNFVNEVKDSDNIKQDMSIDVYGRDDEKEGDEGADIAALYNA